MGINQGPISLDQKYTQGSGHVFLTGIQALVRLPMAQIRRDRAAGLNTAGFISGYRGSPLGGYDQQLFAARKHLEQYDIKFQPGVNEDLAATAIWGSQQLNLSPGARHDGVVGIWYGKGPGVDRCGDVFRHGNAAGSARNGGVLCLRLDQKYTQGTGHIFLTGIQALVRLPMAQIRRDRAAGLNTAGFISGYRGSPLGGYDQQLFAARKHLEQYNIKFQPGVNEDLAATAVWGSQQLNLSPGAKYDGVVGIWYGKGPGVDRCGDVFRHGNAAGSAKNGGVLCLAGDDHGAKSSTVPHQSDHAFISALMPYLYPSSIHEMIEMGLLGIAMSRYSGCWVGMKVITETVETTAEIDLTDEMKPFIIPTDFEMPPGGLNLRWPDDRYDAGPAAAGLQGLCRDRVCPRQQGQPHHHGFAECAATASWRRARATRTSARRCANSASRRRSPPRSGCGSTRSACPGRWSRKACANSPSASKRSSSSKSAARSSRTRSSRSCSTGATTSARASSARWTITTSASCPSPRNSASPRWQAR